MKTSICLLAAALVLPAIATAQERAAGQAYDAQVNWTSLKNSLDLVSNQNKALAATLDKMRACNTKKMIFSPTDPAADADGCTGMGSLKIQTVTATATAFRFPAAAATCPAGTYLISGGANCTGAGYVWLAESSPKNNGWYGRCDTAKDWHSSITVSALCAK